ncbi:MAG: serine hydrolase, partial [Mycobacteriales bacterium]
MSAPELDPAAVGEALAYADDWLAFRRRYLRIPGVQAAVWCGGELALSTAHGRADVERDVPLTARHFATAVLQLLERGELRLDDTCDQFLPRPVRAAGRGDRPRTAALHLRAGPRRLRRRLLATRRSVSGPGDLGR